MPVTCVCFVWRLIAFVLSLRRHHIAPYREMSSKGGLVAVAHEAKTEKK